MLAEYAWHARELACIYHSYLRPRQERMHLCYHSDGKRSQCYHLHHIAVTLEASLWSPCAHNTDLLRPPLVSEVIDKGGGGKCLFCFQYKLFNCNCMRSVFLICSHALAKSFDVWWWIFLLELTICTRSAFLIRSHASPNIHLS